MKQLTKEQRGKLVYIVTGAVVAYIFIAAVTVFLFQAQPVEANSDYFNQTMGQYPSIVGSRIASCSLCHTASIPSLNSYGLAFANAGADSAAFKAIESMDSDGDGFTNLQEINAFTFPGNAADKPVVPTNTSVPPTATSLPPTSTPTNTALPTNTAVPPTNTSVPPTNTAVPPTNTAVPPTATSVSPTGTAVPPTSTSVPPTAVPTNTSVPPTAVPTSTSVPPSTTVDVDIKEFKVSEEFKMDEPKPIRINVYVRARNRNGGQATLTVVGMQNGVQVYAQTITVNATREDTRVSLASYTPSAAGNITWTATLSDGDPDNDTAPALQRPVHQE